MIFLVYLNVDKKNKFMNIFEEIAERYTYNGVVSLKALDDDIVTLENQIDSWLATLNELRLRGKKSSTIVEKIRDGKIRLSLLKAVYKRESDKTNQDDVIADVLGISAKNANEIETPGTAADNKEPVRQNFEKAEIEVINEDKPESISADEGINSESTVPNIEDSSKDTPETVTVGNYTEEAADLDCVSQYNLSGFTEESGFFARFKIEDNNSDSTVSVLENIQEEPQKNLSVINGDEDHETENDNKAAEPCNENISEDTRVTTNESDFEMDFDVYEPFSKEEARIVESADLFNVTDMPNTMYVYTRADFKKRLMQIRFVDIRDYGVFVELLKQREEERCSFLKRLLKKPKSIFIYVTTVINGSEKTYKYEFMDCKLVDAFDDEYASKAYIDSISDPYTCNTNYHNCGVTFKYKKIIIT